MKLGRHKISESEAISVAIEHAVKEGKSGEIDFSEVQEKSGEWVLKGTCGDKEASNLAEEFQIVIDNKGKVKSSNFNLSPQKETPQETETMRVSAETLKTGDSSDDAVFSEISSKEEKYNDKLNKKSSIFRDDFERTVKKIESLLSAEQQLYLEREKLQKELEAKALTLEQKINGIKSEIQTIKLFLKQDNCDKPSTDLQMQIAQRERQTVELPK